MDEGEADVEIVPQQKDSPAPGRKVKTGNVVAKAEELTRECGTDYETIADELAMKSGYLRDLDEQNFRKSSKKLEYAAYLLPATVAPIFLGFLLIFSGQLLLMMDQNAAIQKFENCLRSEEWSAWSACGRNGVQERTRCGLVMKKPCTCPRNAVCGNQVRIREMQDSDWKQDTFVGADGLYNVSRLPNAPC